MGQRYTGNSRWYNQTKQVVIKIKAGVRLVAEVTRFRKKNNTLVKGVNVKVVQFP